MNARELAAPDFAHENARALQMTYIRGHCKDPGKAVHMEQEQVYDSSEYFAFFLYLLSLELQNGSCAYI